MVKKAVQKGFRRMRAWIFPFVFAGLNFSCPAMLRIDVTAAPYGAIPNDGLDDSPAFQSAINAMLASTPRGGYLYVPNGDYHFSSQVYTRITDVGEGLAIQGQSRLGVRLFCNNTNGVIWLDHLMRNQDVTVRDMTFVANRTGAGTALRVSSTPGGAQPKKVVTLLDLTVTYATNSAYYFNTGLAVKGIQRPIIKNCSVAAPTTDSDMSDTSPNFLPDFGIDVGDCYSPEVQNCSVSGARTAYSMVMTGLNEQEDGGFFNCTADYCRLGAEYYIPNGPRAGFQFNNCDFRARDNGLIMHNRRCFHVSENTFRQLSPAYPLVDVCTINANVGVIVRNTFVGDLSGGRVNVSIGVGDKAIIIDANILSGAESSAIVVDPTATDVLVQDTLTGTNVWSVDASGLWTNPTNWSDGTVPGVSRGGGSMDVAVFPTELTTNRIITVDANRNIGNIIFANPAHQAAMNNSTSVGYTLSGGSLKLSDGGVVQVTDQSGTNTATISSDIEIQNTGGSATFRNDAAGNKAGLAIAGAVSGMSISGETTTVYLDGASTSAGNSPTLRNNTVGVISDGVNGGRVKLVKNGTGLWTVGLISTFTGGFEVNAGTVRYFSSGSKGFGLGTVTIGNGAVFNHANSTEVAITNAVVVDGDFTFSGAANAAWSGTMDLRSGIRTITVNIDTAIPGTISNGGLNKAGSKTLTLSGANTYGGGTTVSAGTLRGASAQAFGTGGIAVANGAALVLQNNAAIDGQAGLVLGSSSSLALDFAGTNAIGSISLDGGTTTLPDGTYDPAALSMFGTGTYTGSGSLVVGGFTSDPANTPYWWLAQYGLTNFDADAMADADGDGLLSWQEYVAGTDPTNTASVFKITGSETTPHGTSIRWTSVSNRFYDLVWSTNLMDGFADLPGAGNLPATPPENAYTNPLGGGASTFYRVGVHE